MRDISTKYRQTALGYFWAVFPPLMQSLVFILLDSSQMLAMEETGIPYTAYVIMGTVFFGLFTDAMNAPLKLINASKTMLVKINFPREALILAAIGETLFSFGIKLVLLFITLIVFRVPIKPAGLFAFIPLAGLLIMGIMIGVLLVPAGALFHDLTYALVLVNTALMFSTPVGFPPPKEGLLSLVIQYNPLTPMIMAARELLIKGTSSYMTGMALIMSLSLVLLFIGWMIFRLALPIVIERMGG
ncbi:ABC transporter permease [bacterium]|nr:ABC transporter permease [bacterium]